MIKPILGVGLVAVSLAFSPAGAASQEGPAAETAAAAIQAILQEGDEGAWRALDEALAGSPPGGSREEARAPVEEARGPVSPADAPVAFSRGLPEALRSLATPRVLAMALAGGLTLLGLLTLWALARLLRRVVARSGHRSGRIRRGIGGRRRRRALSRDAQRLQAQLRARRPA